MLKVQFKKLPTVIGVQRDEVTTLTDVCKLVQQLKIPLRGFISKAMKILKLIIVMLATNTMRKKFFSAMRCLLTYLRTNMGQNRLNNTVLFPVHKERL